MGQDHGSNDRAAQELLRRLREQYHTSADENENSRESSPEDSLEDSPEDVFAFFDTMEETVAADNRSGKNDDGENGSESEDDEVTRRIVEMFSQTHPLTERLAAEESEQKPEQEQEQQDDVFFSGEKEKPDRSMQESEGPMSESSDFSELSELTELAKLAELSELPDFEDEVGDIALPDYGQEDAGEPAMANSPDEACSTSDENTDDVGDADDPQASDQMPAEESLLFVENATNLETEDESESESVTLTEVDGSDESDESNESDGENMDSAASSVEDETVLDEFDQVPLPSNRQEEGENKEEKERKETKEEAKEKRTEPKQDNAALAAGEVPSEPRRVTPRPSPLDAALAAQRKKHQAKGERHSVELRASETLSENDVALLLRLGYENDLRSHQSIEQLRRIEKQTRELPITDRQRHGLAFGYSAAERDSDQNDPRRETRIKQTYRQNMTTVTWRLVFTVLFAVALTVLDAMPLFASVLPPRVASLATHPVAHLLALQLLVLCAIPSGKRLLYGAGRLLQLSPEPICALLPVLVGNLVYNVIMALQPTRYVLLNAPTAWLLVLFVVCDRLDLVRESATYDMVSAGEHKLVLSPTKPHKKKILRGGRIVKIIDEDAGLPHYRVERAEKIDGYFELTNAPTRRYRRILTFLAAQLLLTLGVGGVSLLCSGLSWHLLPAMLATMQLCAPVGILCMNSYALFAACRALRPAGATILGPGAVDEMAQEKILIFSDVELLQAKSSTEITMKGGGDPKRYVRYARRVFCALGGTLGKINTSDLSEDRTDGGVEIIRVYPEGVEARLDGKVHLLLGSSSFMKKNKIAVPTPDAEMMTRRSDESSILYLAVGGQVRLGYEINYRIHGSFEQMAAQLAKGTTTVAICSADPNITEQFLAASRAKKKTPIRLYKPIRHERRRVLDSEQSGIVSVGKVRSVAAAIRWCEQIVENERWMSKIQAVLMFCGALLTALTFGVGTGAEDALFGVLLMPLSLLFTLPVWVIGKTAPKTQETTSTPRPRATEDVPGVDRNVDGHSEKKER